MALKHLMQRIDESYGRYIMWMVKTYAPKGVEYHDMYTDILIAIYHKVRRKKVKLRDKRSMHSAIIFSAIDKRRVEMGYYGRATQVEDFEESAKSCNEPIQISGPSRIKELKQRVRDKMSRMDARIILSLAFPSPELQDFARRKPVNNASVKVKIDKGMTPVIYHWHVLEFLGISRVRLVEATMRARDVIGYVIEEGGE